MNSKDRSTREPAEGDIERGMIQIMVGEPATSLDHLAGLVRIYASRKRLSVREYEVFSRFVLEAKSSKEIADDLGIAYPTVKLYWTRICRKLDCGSAIEALVAFVKDAATSFRCELCGSQEPRVVDHR